MRIKLVLVLINLSLTLVINAQDPLLRHYTTKDGLPSSKVFRMIQDHEGFIWFGTDVGVTRFDGKKFQNFSISDGLSDNFIIMIKMDSKNRIWFLGLNGTVSYWKSGIIYNAGNDNVLKNIFSPHSLVDFFEDSKNRLWFVSQYDYLILDQTKVSRIDLHLGRTGIVMNGKQGQLILTNNKPLLMQYNDEINDTFQSKFNLIADNGYYRLKDESILCIADEGLVLQKDTNQKLIINFPKEYKKNSRLNSLVISTDSLLWITAMGKGLYCYDLRNINTKPIIYLKNKISVDVLSDQEGNIWISTLNDGLYMIPASGKKVTLYNKDKGLSENESYAVYKRETGALLVGQQHGKIEQISTTGISQLKTMSCSEPANVIIRIINKGNDTWIASTCGLIHQNHKTGCNHWVLNRDANLNSSTILGNIKDIALKKDKIYIACGARIVVYNTQCTPESSHFANSIFEKNTRMYSIYCDRANRLWYGTIAGLHSREGNSITDHAPEDPLLGKRINSIAETDDSSLILATHGYGILFYKNGKLLTHLTSMEGLSNDICRKVFVYKNYIYVSTPSGVSILYYSNGKVQSIQNINTGNFLPSNDVNDVYADEKDVSVATMGGVAIIDQASLKKIDLAVPKIYITAITVNDSIIARDFIPHLPYNKNSINISFIGINYQQPDAVNYRFRLKDDQEWQKTQNTFLEFPFLSPGDYIFQVQARISNGKWSEIRSFTFTIVPPFWTRFWFRLIVILAISLIIYLILKDQFKKRKNIKETRIKIDNQITMLEQQALQTMMNPHFIFNVMNSIQHFINSDNKESANHYLADFATLIRMNLNISYKRFIPLEEEISYLKLYLSFEKLRFGDLLSYDIIVDPEIDTAETTIAVMMIQPFIENAIWHGIMPTNSKGHIKIQFEKEANDLIKISIEDNGVGINEKFLINDINFQDSETHALSMTMKRLNLLGKTSPHKLYISYKHKNPEWENKGTIAELVLPAMYY